MLSAPFLVQADATIANVAIPAIQSDLAASEAGAELVIGGYLISYAVLLITGARLGKTQGHKRIFLLGVLIFGLTSLVGGLAPTVTVLIIMRVAQGVGAALMFPQALTGIQLHFTGSTRTRAIAFFALALASGAVLGQVLGGVLVSADIAGIGWRLIFLINTPICIAVIAAGIHYLPEDKRRSTVRVDMLGIGTLSATMLLIVVPLTLGRAQGWPAWAWLCLVAGVPAFAVFLATQRHALARARDPLVNVTALARPATILGLVALLTASGTYYALLFTLAQYFQAGLARGALASGLILVPWVAAFGVAGQITRRLPRRVAPMLPFLGYLLLATAYVAISVVVASDRPSDTVLAVLLGFGGLGLGTGFATLIGHLTNTVPADYASDISGVITSTQQVGGAIGMAAFGSLYLTLAVPAAAAPGANASHAFAVTTLALGVAAVFACVTAYLATHTDNMPWPAGRRSVSANDEMPSDEHKAISGHDHSVADGP